jgi:hypothetical protein
VRRLKLSLPSSPRRKVRDSSPRLLRKPLKIPVLVAKCPEFRPSLTGENVLPPRRIHFATSAGRVTPHSVRTLLDYSHSMNDKKLFLKTDKTGLVLGAVLLGTMTGCVGCGK